MERKKMSFFNKVLASVGIGSAMVDTRLEKNTFFPGELVKGIVVVKGGNIDQSIDEIELSLNTSYLKERDDHKYTVTACIERFRITEPFTVYKNETKEIPFTFHMPYDIPLSLGKSKVWVTTGLAIRNAVDPTDKDYINIAPTPLVSAVLKSIEQLGFWLREVECEEAPHRLRRRFPFVQEFEFVPHGGPFQGRLDELEMIVYPSSDADQIELLLQVDRRARGLGGVLAEALDIDETYVRLTVSNLDIPYLTQKLQNIIQKYS